MGEDHPTKGQKLLPLLAPGDPAQSAKIGSIAIQHDSADRKDSATWNLDDDPPGLALAASHEADTALTSRADANMTWKTSSHPVASAMTKNADAVGERWRGGGWCRATS